MAGTNGPVSRPSRTFENDVTEVMTRLRSALAQLIAAAPDDIAKGADLHRSFRLDRTLSWKVFKVAHATDPMAAGAHVPSPASMGTLFKAARKRGVPEALIESAARVAEEFEDVVADHAGDRAAFDSMVSALAQDDTCEQMDLVHRRLGFRAQRHILGVQARTHVKLLALQPSQDPEWLDAVLIQGFVGLRRLRGDAPLIISYSGARDDEGGAQQVRRRPLGHATGGDGMCLLTEYCSQPLPEFRTSQMEDGFLRGEVLTRDVGNRAAATCFEGHVVSPAMPRYRRKGNDVVASVVVVRNPCEVLVVDLLVPPTLYGLVKPSAYVKTDHLGDSSRDLVTKYDCRLPGQPAVRHLGRSASVLHTPDVPRYAEMAHDAFERAGWNAEEFDVYRCRIEYPVMPSSVVVEFDLPTSPSDQ
jgi:hypothetical protein